MKSWIFFLLLTTYYLLPTTTQAQSIDILYQGEGSAAPFYEGGTLWPEEGWIVMMAIPQELGDISKLNYRWSRNSTVLGSLSGIGKNYLRLKGDIFGKSMSIRLEILDKDNNPIIEKNFTISPGKPEVLIYEKHPLYGLLLNKELGSAHTLSSQETTLSAIPLFFTTKDGSINYSWKSSANIDSYTSSVTYRAPDNSSGSAKATVEVSNGNTLRQNVSRSLLIQFNNE